MKHIVEYSAKEEEKELGNIICYPKTLIRFKDVSSTILDTFAQKDKKSFGQVRIFSKEKTKSVIKKILNGNSNLVSNKMNNLSFITDEVSIEGPLPDNSYPREHSKKM